MDKAELFDEMHDIIERLAKVEQFDLISFESFVVEAHNLLVRANL